MLPQLHWQAFANLKQFAKVKWLQTPLSCENQFQYEPFRAFHCMLTPLSPIFAWGMQFLTEIAAFVLLYGTLVNAWVQQGQTMATVRH